MKRAIARKWAQALESGEYKQTIGQLRNGDSFCCLGVLCNLHAQEHPEIAAQQKTKGLYLEHSKYLPDELCDWSGVKSRSGGIPDVVLSGIAYTDLASLNDSAELTFPEIAKVIRKHWREL